MYVKLVLFVLLIIVLGLFGVVRVEVELIVKIEYKYYFIYFKIKWDLNNELN